MIYLLITYILLLFTLLFTKAFTQRMTDLLKEKEDQFVLINFFTVNPKQAASFILFLASQTTMSQVTNWSLDPLLHGHLPTPVAESILGNITFLQKIYLVIMMLSITYPIVHKVLLCSFEKYREIRTRGKQIVVLHHAVEALILTISIPFFTYYMIKVNFQIHELDEVVSLFRAIAIFFAIIMMMYIMEIASRYDGMRPIILFHHLLSCTDGLMLLLFPTSVMFKTASILVYFIVFEAFTFVGLFMYRIFPNSKVTPKIILAGMIMFGGTRPIQVLWVGAAIVGSWGDEQAGTKWQVIMQSIVTIVLTVLQFWTLQIHFNLWKRSQRSVQQHSIEQHDNFNANADADADAVDVKAISINDNSSGDDENEDIDEESQ